MTKERVKLTKDEAIDLVGGERDEIHCFLNSGSILVGADWSWKEFINKLDKASEIELAGSTATKMKHPLAVFSDSKWYFFESNKEKSE